MAKAKKSKSVDWTAEWKAVLKAAKRDDFTKWDVIDEKLDELDENELDAAMAALDALAPTDLSKVRSVKLSPLDWAWLKWGNVCVHSSQPQGA
jgi:hypothetical protein